jgi:DNA-binding GntR family transcriptional regulator
MPRQSKWEPIYDHMLKQILSGALTAWEQCTPIADTARDWDVSPDTVAKAYRRLAEEGHVKLLQGCGYFVMSGVSRE